MAGTNNDIEDDDDDGDYDDNDSGGENLNEEKYRWNEWMRYNNPNGLDEKQF